MRLPLINLPHSKAIKVVIIAAQLLFFFNYDVTAQNASYNLNSIPVGGSDNSVFGFNALPSASTGHKNTAIGHSSLYNNAVGHHNTAIGFSALYLNTIFGNYNTGIGVYSLASNGIGNSNSGLGAFSDVGSNSLTNSTAIGYGAKVNNSNSIQLGNSLVTTIYSGVGTNATLITGGLQVVGGSPGIGKVLTSDALGVATWQTPGGGGGGGDWSLTGNAGTVDGTNFIGTTDAIAFNIRVNNETAGRIEPYDGNTFYGYTAGKNNTDVNNTAIGFQALHFNTRGYNNTAVGLDALYSNVEGVLNVAMGLHALRHNSLGSANVGLGSHALSSNSTGSFNTAVGNVALITNSTGSQNTGLGFGADVLSPSLTNATAIGCGAIVNTSFKVRLGDHTVTAVEGPVAYTVSDGRFKYDVSESDVKGLEFINGLRPVVYNFDTKKFQEFLTRNMADSLRKKYFANKDFTKSTEIRQSGFIAQEVEKLAKELDYDFNGVHVPSSEIDNYSLAYSQFVVPLVKSVQELSNQNQELKKELEELRTMIESIISRNEAGSIKITGSDPDARLFQNAPNPFNKSTLIRYTIPSTAKKAFLLINTFDGIQIKSFDLKNKGGQNIEISGGQLSAGTYIYSLIIDDKLIDSKTMILTH